MSKKSLPTNFRANLYTAVKSAEVTLTLLDRVTIMLDLSEPEQKEIFIAINDLTIRTRNELQQVCNLVQDDE